MQPTAILVIDDHALFRSGILAVLSTAFGRLRVLDSGSLEDALTKCALEPTVVLLDLQLPGIGGMDGIGLIRQRWPASRVVVVSGHDLPATVEAALARGAAAFLSKTDRPERMMEILRNLLDDEPAARPTGDALRPTLTPRQIEVLTLVERGLSNKVIARRLSLSEHTVRGHVQALLSVLGVAGRTEAAFRARQLGLIA